MPRTALRSLRSHALRFLLSAVSVMLAVAALSGSLIYAQAAEEAARTQARRAVPDAAVRVRPDPSAGTGAPSAPRLDERLVRRLAALPGAAGARGESEGRAFLVGSDGALVGAAAEARGVAYRPGAGGADPRYPLAAGSAPRGPGEIAVAERSAHRAGYRLGARARIVVRGTVRRVRVVGLIADHAAPAGSGTLTAFDAATARRFFAPPGGGYRAVSLRAEDGTSAAALAARAGKALPRGLQAVTRAHLVREADTTGVQKISTLLLVFAGVAVLISTFLVGATFAMLGVARVREHALLRAVGAGRGRIVRQVLTEAVLIGLLASAAGYALGTGLATALGGLFGYGGAPLPPLRPFTPVPLAASFGVGVVFTAVAAYLPARRAASVAPVTALRTAPPSTGGSLRRRAVAGSATSAAGALLLLLATGEPSVLYLAVPVLFVGLVVATPLLADGVAALLRAPLTRLAGVRGRLAAANVRRNPRRTAATASALMIGVALVSAITVALASAGATAADRAAADMTSELRVTPVDFAEIGPGTAARIARLPDAAAVSGTVSAFVDLPGGGSLDATAAEPATIAELAGLRIRAGSLDRLGRGVAVASSEARTRGWRLGDRISGSVEVPGASKAAGPRRSLPIVALYDGPETAPTALLSTTALPGGGTGRDRAAPYAVLINAAPGRVAALRDDIRRTLGNPALRVLDRQQAADEAVRPLRPLFALMYAMLSVALLIGLLGVANTMSMAVFERVREIGLLRALGLGRREVASAVRLESGLVALLGGVLGVVAGGAAGAAAVLAQQGAELAVPWGRLALSLGVTVLAGTAASAWPARRAAAVPLQRALGSDTE